MKANELMIGDWVKLNGDPLPRQVQELLIDSVTIQCWPYRYDDIFPIPLTKEILEKNGFELREGCTSAWDWNHGEQSVHISGNHTCPIGQTVTIYTSGGCAGAAFSSHRTLSDHRIRGIHELQHALRLCGIEKEIAL